MHSLFLLIFFFSSRRRHTRCLSDWSSDVCSSDLASRSAIQKILFQGLNAELPDAKVAKHWDKGRWSELYTEGIIGYFRNLRHVYRFLSSFTFHVRHHTQTGSFEVNPIDLIGIEIL